jgi:hypothetical protein
MYVGGKGEKEGVAFERDVSVYPSGGCLHLGIVGWLLGRK